MHYLEIFHDINFIYEKEASFIPAPEVGGPECAPSRAPRGRVFSWPRSQRGKPRHKPRGAEIAQLLLHFSWGLNRRCARRQRCARCQRCARRSSGLWSWVSGQLSGAGAGR